MKIQERERGYWNGREYKNTKPLQINVDGVEILRWMKSIAKIEGAGIQEIPKGIKPGNALGRFVDMETLKRGYGICVYVVRPNGMYKQWVYVDSPRFQNDGTGSQVACLSKEALLMHIIKYKDGKRVTRPEGKAALVNFTEAYALAATKGTSGSTNMLKNFLENTLGIEVDEDDFTLEGLNTILREMYEAGSLGEGDVYKEDRDYYRVKETYSIA